MFFPVESLKRGGRFYLCWVADSWPLRFATITQRQLWSQDIRKLCDDLMEVVNNESGAPTRRFSLRLSSQLMRGLVRLYQRKVTIYLGELCMLNANVTKHVNRKFVIREEVITDPTAQVLPQLPQVAPELPDEEERIEEIIEKSSNAVANIEDITLKEAVLPELQLINDDFGELHPDQALQLLNKTVELMLGQDASAVHHSLELDVSNKSHDRTRGADKSHDRSRLVVPDNRMEMISEHDITLFNKSGDHQLQIGDITKEIPDIPDIPLPVLPEPQPEIEKENQDKHMEIDQGIPAPVVEDKDKEPEEIMLEELEDPQPLAKRRRAKNKIVDKYTKLSSKYFRARLDNCAVELRCKKVSEDFVDIRVPSHILLGRASHAGQRVRPTLGQTLTRLFLRNLGPVNKSPLAEREIEMARTRGHLYRSVLERIDEEEALPQIEPRIEKSREFDRTMSELPDVAVPEITGPYVTIPEITLPEAAGIVMGIPEVTAPEVIVPEVTVTDFEDLPTQTIETLSQQERKRIAEIELGETVSTKVKRSRGKTSQGKQLSNLEELLDHEINKENISDNIQQPHRDLVTVVTMLQEAGLEEPPKAGLGGLGRDRADSGTETPLGSLDRTKVSLGDSEKTCDSVKFVRDNWGTTGTMTKILMCLKGNRRPLDLPALLEQGPVLPRLRHIIAARCFTSILKLIHHRFIKVLKDPATLEIRDIMLGPKFDAP